MWDKDIVEHKVVSYKKHLSFTLCIFILLSSAKSYSFPIGSNSWHVNSPFQAKHNADIVCKIKVLSVHPERMIKSNLLPGAPDICRMIANSKVLSIIKGKCPQVIDIEFHYPKEGASTLSIPTGQVYTKLSRNEVCIVFLKLEKSSYRLNRINSKLRVQSQIVNYNLGDTPNLRLLAEFLSGCNSNDELIKLQAIEEIGYLGNTMQTSLRDNLV